MGPVVFLLLVTSVSALDDVSELSNWGAKIFRRLGRIAIFLTLMSMAVALVLFPVLGGESGIQLQIRPLAFTAFATGSEAAGMDQLMKLLVKDFGVEEKFSSFWVPLNQVMLKPSSTMTFVLGSFFVAEITGTPASLSFLVILLILTVQLSLASPGLTPGLALLFEALSLPAEYVGLFSAYGVFIRNAASAFGITYRVLEGIEAAHGMNVRQTESEESW